MPFKESYFQILLMVIGICNRCNNKHFTQANDLNYSIPYMKTNADTFQKKQENTFYYLYLLNPQNNRYKVQLTHSWLLF